MTEDQIKFRFHIGDKVKKNYGFDRDEIYKIINVKHDKRKGNLYDISGIINVMGVGEHDLCFSHENPYNQPKIPNNWNPPINKNDII